MTAEVELMREDAQKARYIESRTDLKTDITMIWYCIRDDIQE